MSDVLETIESIFDGVDDRVMEWLYAHEWQHAFLIRAFYAVQKCFGEGTRVFLRVEDDHDSGIPNFWFNINPSQGSENAVELQDKFWDDFWFDNEWRIYEEENCIHNGPWFT